jgi:acetolactate synthase small subunit
MAKTFDPQTLELFKQGRSIQRELAGKMLNPKLTLEQKADLKKAYESIRTEISDLKKKYYKVSDSGVKTKAESYVTLLRAYEVTNISKVRSTR